MRCKIVRFQKLMWRNIMKLTKSKKKTSVLHYSINYHDFIFSKKKLRNFHGTNKHKNRNFFKFIYLFSWFSY